MSVPVNELDLTVTDADRAVDPLECLRMVGEAQTTDGVWVPYSASGHRLIRLVPALARRLLAAENTIRSLSEILYGRPDACVTPDDVREMLRERSKAQLRAVAAEAELARLKAALEETR